jgi:hypothetical protein
MVEPINFKHMIDLKRSVENSKSNVRKRPVSDQNSFASELDKQKELSESQVHAAEENDRIEIHDGDHGETLKREKKEKKEDGEEEFLPGDDETGQKIDATTKADEVADDPEEHNLDIKV